MKLYAWQPQGFGEESFFVMAESEEAARAAVDAKIKAAKEHVDDDSGCWEWIDSEGWGTDYYVLTVAEAGVVLMNTNS